MSIVLAVDPGLRLAGVALFEHGELVRCGTIKAPARARGNNYLWRCVNMACRIRDWAEECCEPYDLVCEWPQIYRSTKSKGNPNQIVPLAALCGALGTFVAVMHPYTPAEWAGQLDKNAKFERVRSRLTPAEAKIVPLQQDAIDAVGIGLHHLGRFDRKRVFPGAT